MMVFVRTENIAFATMDTKGNFAKTENAQLDTMVANASKRLQFPSLTQRLTKRPPTRIILAKKGFATLLLLTARNLSQSRCNLFAEEHSPTKNRPPQNVILPKVLSSNEFM